MSSTGEIDLSVVPKVNILRSLSYYVTNSIFVLISPYTSQQSLISIMPSVQELSDICIPMVDEVAYTPKKLRVVVIGAGFSGLIFAHKYQYEQPELKDFFDIDIFEANTDVGGTWRVNTLVIPFFPLHLIPYPQYYREHDGLQSCLLVRLY